MHISTPGRICLFGEHQDYLGLPVIPAAISLRIHIDGGPSADTTVTLRLPDIGSTAQFDINGTFPYTAAREYFKSAVNVARKHGAVFPTGFDCTVHGTIPINSGTSSSSALTVTWLHFLLRSAGVPSAADTGSIARLTFDAEVTEFGEPGGMMDHFSTAMGGVLFLEFAPAVRARRIVPSFGTFVLGDSHEPKDTISILRRVKNGVLDTVTVLQQRFPEFSLASVRIEELPRYTADLSPELQGLLRGTVRNRDITREAEQVLTAPHLDEARFGALMNEHHGILRDVLRISTPKIDRMLSSAIAAGAVCGKINGSGGGGCMFVYAPRDPERVAAAIEHEGGTAHIITVDEGTRLEEGPLSW